MDPEIRAAEEAAEYVAAEDAGVRSTFGGANIDKMLERQMAARRAGLAEIASRKAQGAAAARHHPPGRPAPIPSSEGEVS